MRGFAGFVLLSILTVIAFAASAADKTAAPPGERWTEALLKILSATAAPRMSVSAIAWSLIKIVVRQKFCSSFPLSLE